MKSLSNFLVYIVEKKEDEPNKNHFKNGKPTAAGYEILFAMAVNLTQEKYKTIDKNTIRQAAEEAGLKPNDVRSCVDYFTSVKSNPNKDNENRIQEMVRKIGEMNASLPKEDKINPPVHAIGGQNGKTDIAEVILDKDGIAHYKRRISMKLSGPSRWDNQNVASHLKDDLSDKIDNKGILLKIKNEVSKNPSKYDQSILTKIDNLLKMSKNTKEEQNKILGAINSLCNDHADIKKLYINALITGDIDPKKEDAIDNTLVFDATNLVWNYEPVEKTLEREYKRFEGKDKNILRPSSRTNKNGVESSRGIMDAFETIPDEVYERFKIDPTSIRRTAVTKYNGEIANIILYNINGKYFCTDESGNKISVSNPKKLFIANNPQTNKNPDFIDEVEQEDGTFKKRILKTGPDGGIYYISDNGTKVYVQKDKNGKYKLKK